MAVLGPIPQDRIITHRAEVFEKYGCALYTTIAMAKLLDDNDVVAPIVHVRRADEGPIKEILSAYPNIELTGVRSAADRGAVVELEYVDQNTRIERQTEYMPPIRPADVEFALDFDAFVGVPITDYELAQSTLEYIKANSRGFILLDGHGPTSTLAVGGERVRRLWVDRDAWLPSIDILKMNLEEAGCSWFNPGVREPGSPVAVEELPFFAEHCLRQGVTAVCVTLDQEGCVAFVLDEDDNLAQHTIPRITVENVVDTTGCGDSFAAGMAFGFLQDHDIISAARYGNAMGAQRCATSELDAYLPLAETNAQLAAAYGTSGN